MKMAPVSADLVIKLALAGGVLLAVWYLLSKASGVASGAATAVGNALNTVNPLNNDNVIYQTANTVTGGTPDLPLGVRIYNFFHPDEALQNQPAIPVNFGVMDPNQPW